MMRSVFLLSVLVLACAPDSHLDVTEDRLTPPAQSQLVEITNPEFVVLRPVSAKAVEGALSASLQGGDLYFDDENQILDLRHLDPLSAAVEQGSDGNYGVFVSTTEEGNELLHSWTSSNIGNRLGVFLDGRLISAPFIESPLTSMILLESGFTQSEAELIAARIRRGGGEL